MTYLIIKAVRSGTIIAMVSEVSKRNPALGGLFVSLPLVCDTRDTDRIAAHAESAFWYVLPSLPMFLLVPILLRRDVPFWPALACGGLLTIALYAAMIWIGPRLGRKL